MEQSIDEAKELLKQVLISDEPPILFVGAGFSYGAANKIGALCGKNLKGYIYDELVDGNIDEQDREEVSGYNLRRLCDEVYHIYKGKNELYKLLVDGYINTKPNEFHAKLTKYPWKEIYTLNIDDLIENIYDNDGIEIMVVNNPKLENVNNKSVVLYKLHGCVHNVQAGLIFSENEYSEMIRKRIDPKLNKLTNDIQYKNVIFIGTSMDEPDVKYYLETYKEAGCRYRNNKLIFIDINPSKYLRTYAEENGAIVVKASTEDFLNFVSDLHYNPSEIEKAKINLSYRGISLLSNLAKLYKSPYESKLYEGYFCKWQDVYDGWTFEETNYINATEQLSKLIKEDSNICCFSIYGSYFTGKSCLLKQLGYYLQNQGYEVMEYVGRYLDINTIVNYINTSINSKFTLIIDGASYYYEQIEKLFLKNIGEKKLVILTASRSYYHLKKKYYLEGNCYSDFVQKDAINGRNGKIIRDKLAEKMYLSYIFSMPDEEQIREICKQRSIANLIYKLTYGNISKMNINKIDKILSSFSESDKKLLIELAIFDKADIEIYPRELFTERYGKSVGLDGDIDCNNMRVVDFVRMSSNGLSLRNAIVDEYILKQNISRIPEIIIEILKYLSKYVMERKNDVWYIIFQCLLKEEVLESKLKLRKKDIERIYLSVKSDFKEISYYWLQLGLYMQKNDDYVSAYNYLEKSASIRPKSYKIQHAIARNYMRHANNTSKYSDARQLFNEGEKRIKELIESKEYNMEKAKPFSVNSYILEKIKFIYKFNIEPTDKELQYMNDAINSVNVNDTYKRKVQYAFFVLLQDMGKLNILKITQDSPYIKYLGRNNKLSDKDLEYESIVEDL